MTNSILTENPSKKKAANIPTDKLHTFEGHPFQVIDNEEMESLAESIQAQGIISPLIVRPMEEKQANMRSYRDTVGCMRQSKQDLRKFPL